MSEQEGGARPLTRLLRRSLVFGPAARCIVAFLIAALQPANAFARADHARSYHAQQDEWEAELFRAGIERDLAGSHQLAALHRFVASLSEGQRTSVRDLLLQANQPAERFFVLKALVAGQEWDSVVQYATEMRGMAEDEIVRRSTARDADPLPQQWEFSCAPAVVQFAMAEADPRFAWDLNNDAKVARGPSARSGMRAKQQKAWLEQYGGVATPRGDRTGRGITLAELLNDKLSRIIGATYTCQQVINFDNAIALIAQNLRAGYDVPLCLSWATPEAATGAENHFVLALSVRGTAGNLEFQIYDPATGKVDWVSAAAMRNNTLPPIFDVYQRLTHFYEASPTN